MRCVCIVVIIILMPIQLFAGSLALVVGDDSSLDSNKDLPLKNYLENNGHTVTVKDDADSSYDPTIFDAVIISESVSSSNTSWLKNQAVGILTVEGANNDEFEMGGAGDSGSTASDADVSIVNNTHYITSHLSLGNITISSSDLNIGFMKSWANDVIPLAQSADDHTEAWLLVVERNGLLQGGSHIAADRRVFLGARYFANLTVDATTIFDRALLWVTYNESSDDNQTFPRKRGKRWYRQCLISESNDPVMLYLFTSFLFVFLYVNMINEKKDSQ